MALMCEVTFLATLEADVVWRSLFFRSIRILRWVSRFLESRFGSVVSIGEAGSVINSPRHWRCPFWYLFRWSLSIMARLVTGICIFGGRFIGHSRIVIPHITFHRLEVGLRLLVVLNRL